MRGYVFLITDPFYLSLKRGGLVCPPLESPMISNGSEKYLCPSVRSVGDKNNHPCGRDNLSVGYRIISVGYTPRLLVNQFYSLATLFESDKVFLVEVADAFLECLLAYFETLVYLFGIALVTKVTVAVVLIEIF